MDSSKNDSNEKLFLACEQGDLVEVKSAIALGAKLKLLNRTNYTPLMIASNGGYADIVKYLIAKGADVDQTNEGNGSALMLAVLKNHEEVVAVLLEAGAQVNIPNKSGNTPLFAAAYNGFNGLLSLLIAHGADVNLQNNHGTTPIMEAVNRNFIVSVDILIRAGANIYLKNKNGETALKIAAINPIDYKMIFRLLSVMSSDEYNLVKQQENLKPPSIENKAPQKKRRSSSNAILRKVSHSLSKLTFGLLSPISLQEIKDNNHQAQSSSYFEQYHKEVLCYQKDIFSILGTLKHPNDKPISFLDLPADVILLILSNRYPDWYQYRLKRDMSYITDTIFQVVEKRTQPDKAAMLAVPSLTFQFSQMHLSSYVEENEGHILEEKFSCSEKSENRIS